MCRNIRVLYNFEPPTTPEEVEAAALQYVRKVSGLRVTLGGRPRGVRAGGARDRPCDGAPAGLARGAHGDKHPGG